MIGPKPIYQLGQTRFSITHADPDFEPVIGRLLRRCEEQKVDHAQVYDVQMGLSLNIVDCLKLLLNQHQNCLLIQAACLLSPDGQCCLVSGARNSGKTTLAIALALRHGWKVITEDTLIIDTQKNQITSVTAPFHLKPGTRDALSDICIEVPGFVLRDWFPLSEQMRANDCAAVFALAVHLDGEVSNAPHTSSKISKSEYVRKLLPISNLLTMHGTNKFMDYLPEECCYSICGGNVKERLQNLLELWGNCPT